MKKSFFTSLLSLLIFISLGAMMVYAEPTAGGSPGGVSGGSPGIEIKINNPFQDRIGNNLFALMKVILNDIIMPIGGVLVVLAFIYSGFLYVTAQGNETSIKKANMALLYSAIGTAVLLGSWVLATAICKTIGQLGGPVCPS